MAGATALSPDLANLLSRPGWFFSVEEPSGNSPGFARRLVAEVRWCYHRPRFGATDRRPWHTVMFAMAPGSAPGCLSHAVGHNRGVAFERIATDETGPGSGGVRRASRLGRAVA